MLTGESPFAAHSVPRVTIPVLMLSGRYDDVFPLETHARPMFERLGTPPSKSVTWCRTGALRPATQLISEALDWFDRCLGPTR
jgi:pimeloyl-ACP methyl ester carboxylesterase